MTSKELTEILRSDEFRHELEEMSSYLASIMQERPIVNLLTKYLWRRGYNVELEDKKCDLTGNGKKLEFKFNYDKMAEEKLIVELQTWSNLTEMCDAVSAKPSIKNWGVMPRIHQDVCVKKPDLFVWIICSRDLSKVPVEHLCRINLSKEQRDYNAEHPYGEDLAFLSVANSLLERLQPVRPFSVVQEAVVTDGDFPSTYHFLICEFSKPNGTTNQSVQANPEA